MLDAADFVDGVSEDEIEVEDVGTYNASCVPIAEDACDECKQACTADSIIAELGGGTEGVCDEIVIEAQQTRVPREK